ncbi:MAG TPA: ATP-binding protein [Thermoanaerobaculia bacterium]|jgi:signal transduction histidine kinase/CheY-like chemotaxis protein
MSDRVRRLETVEIPLIRVAGSILLSFAVLLHQRFLLDERSFVPWLFVTALLAFYAAAAWGLVTVFYDRVNLTKALFAGDLVIWTVAIYATGAESSWLFFILLMRVADQVRTTFRRCLWFAGFATACYAGLLLWVQVVDGRPVATAEAVVKTLTILCAGIYISLAARSTEAQRERLTVAIRTAREASRRAEEASAAKSEFLANMSHEMRTPLHGVLGMLQLAIDEETRSTNVRRLELARRSAESLLATVDEILDLAKIEARKVELEPLYFSIRELLTETMKSVAVPAAAKALTLAYYVEPEVRSTVWGDPVRLRQVIVNLVGNAIKFTPAGGEIAVQVMRADREHLRFEVRDSGIGIEEAWRERIFQPFTQGDNSHGRRYGGTGLGLAIVSRLVGAMGGRIELTSVPSKGSTFIFDVAMPGDPAGTIPPRPSWEVNLAGRSVLVVEPNETSRHFLAEMLRHRGLVVSSCATADDVPEGDYDCAVTADPRVLVEPKVIVNSPIDHVADELVRVMRPVGERELLESVAVVLGLLPRRVEYTLRRQQPAEGAISVLVVEDNPVSQEFAAEALRRMGHRAMIVADGDEALSVMTANRFDLVLMDVQMPGIDGLEATRTYRGNGGRTPIVGLTANTRREDRDACLEAGMNAVLTKPLDARQLASIIRQVTGVESIVEAVGGNMSLLAKVSDAFAKQTPPLLATMRQAMTTRDGESLYQSAHKLKGSISNFAEETAAGLAQEMESAARIADFEKAAALMPRLEAAVGDLERRMEAALG